MLSLKAKCETHLINSITTESVSEILLIADFHQCTALKAKCVLYIRDHLDEVTATDGWKVLEEMHDALVKECDF